jgi:hypothetical protein
MVWYWIHEFVIAKLFPQVSEQKQYNNLANNQSCWKREIQSREWFQVTKTPNDLITHKQILK